MSDSTTLTVTTIGDLVAKKTVTQALAFVARNAPSIGKDSKSPEGYAYRGIEQIMEAVGPMLAAEGVVIIPEVTIVSVTPVLGMKEGWTDTQVEVRWTIVGPDGSLINGQTCGIGRDKSDKGANKAQTQAYKYLLIPLLNIGLREDDVEAHDTRHETDAAPPDPRAEAAFAALKTLEGPVRVEAFRRLMLPASPKASEVRAAIVEWGTGTVTAVIDACLKDAASVIEVG